MSHGSARTGHKTVKLINERCFLHAGPKAWNALPAKFQDLTEHNAFKRQLRDICLNARSLHECLAAGHIKCISAGPCGFGFYIFVHNCLHSTSFRQSKSDHLQLQFKARVEWYFF